MNLKNKIKFNVLTLMIMVNLTACVSDTMSPNTSKIKTNESSKYRASWMAGKWGITHRVDGGKKLDASARKSNWVAGAKEIVANVPAADYVITSFTHPAHGYLYTLRDNPNVNVAVEIHPDMVPSLKNEQIILGVIDVYKKAGKKVILYLNSAGPMQASEKKEPQIRKAWLAYVDRKWNGDIGAAWRNLAEGYAKRFKGLVDGYWLDNSRNIAGGKDQIPAFVEMLRGVDPDLLIGVNYKSNYFKNKKGKYLKVASDGIDDKNDTPYKIVRHEVTNEFMDFTNGHITPMRRTVAPPNSWAYEEYTLPHMIEKPWDTYNGEKYALKHAWFPMRFSWSGSRSKLMFDTEQAYRFVRKITDGGAAITWSTTQKNGYMPDEELAIMSEISKRMLEEPKPDYVPYVRPKGAHLVGEK